MINKDLHIMLAGYDHTIGFGLSATEWRVIDGDTVIYSCINDYDYALKVYRELEQKKLAKIKNGK